MSSGCLPTDRHPRGPWPSLKGLAILATLVPCHVTEAQELVTTRTIPAPVVAERPERQGLLGRLRAKHRHAKRHAQRAGVGFPEFFNEPPLGQWVYSHARTQVANGDASQMVLYDYDFVAGSDRLNARGQDRLAQIAQKLPTTFHPVLVERTAHAPGLDQRRRLVVLNELGRGPFPVPPQRVAVASPGRGLAGLDAELVNQNLRIQTLTGGTFGGIGGGAIGGSIGQGFDASGPGQAQRPR